MLNTEAFINRSYVSFNILIVTPLMKKMENKDLAASELL